MNCGRRLRCVRCCRWTAQLMKSTSSRIDRLDEWQDLGGIDIRIDADQVVLRQKAAELDELWVMEGLTAGEMQIPAQSRIVEEPGQLLG